MDANEKKIKQLLSSYNQLLREYEMLDSEIEMLSDRYAELIGSPELDGLLKDLGNRRDEAVMRAARIETAVTSVEDDLARTLLEQRYLAGARWESIADNIGYSIRYVHSLHEKALKMISPDQLDSDG